MDVAGPPAMWHLTADVPEKLDAFVASGVHHGILFKRGAYQFAALAHDEGAIDDVARAMPSIAQSLTPGPRRTA